MAEYGSISSDQCIVYFYFRTCKQIMKDEMGDLKLSVLLTISGRCEADMKGTVQQNSVKVRIFIRL